MNDHCVVPGPAGLEADGSNLGTLEVRRGEVLLFCHIPVGELASEFLVVGATSRKNRHRVSKQQGRC